MPVARDHKNRPEIFWQKIQKCDSQNTKNMAKLRQPSFFVE